MAMILWIVLWFIPSFVVAGIARHRGFSFGAYLAHCLLASPWIAMVTLHVATHGEGDGTVYTPA